MSAYTNLPDARVMPRTLPHCTEASEGKLLATKRFAPTIPLSGLKYR